MHRLLPYCTVTYQFQAAEEGHPKVSGWINGAVHVPDVGTFELGGGWVYGDGSVKPYSRADYGQDHRLLCLTYALGGETDPKVAPAYEYAQLTQDAANLLRALQAACPRRWIQEAAEIEGNQP